MKEEKFSAYAVNNLPLKPKSKRNQMKIITRSVRLQSLGHKPTDTSLCLKGEEINLSNLRDDE